MKPDRLRLRYMTEVRSKAEPGGLSGDVTFLPMEAVGDRGGFDGNDVRPRNEIGTGYSYFEDGDVVRAKVTPCFENGKGAVMRGLAGGRGFGSTELLAMRPRPGINARFLYYVLMSHEFVSRGVGSLYGAHGVKRVPEKLFRDFVAWSPSELTQRAIADYLDREVSRIDAVIVQRQRLADLDRERFEATRRSLVAGTPDGGVARPVALTWTRQLASHWPLRRLRQVARLESGHTPSRQHPEYWVDCQVPWVSLSDVGGFRDEQIDEILETAEAVSELGLANSSARLLPEGTVILSRTASVGFACVLGRPMATTQDFANWVCGPHLRPRYLLHVLRAMTSEFEKLRYGSTHQTIYMPDIKRLEVPLPSLSEQDAIIRAVGNLAGEHRHLQELVRRQVAVLQERRHALITAAVTGQLDIVEAA